MYVIYSNSVQINIHSFIYIYIFTHFQSVIMGVSTWHEIINITKLNNYFYSRTSPTIQNIIQKLFS